MCGVFSSVMFMFFFMCGVFFCDFWICVRVWCGVFFLWFSVVENDWKTITRTQYVFLQFFLIVFVICVHLSSLLHF